MRQAHRARILTAATLLLLCAPSARVAADTPAAPPAADAKDGVDALFKKFAAAAKVGDWPAAYEAMQQAYQKKQTYDVLGNLGTAELQLGKVRDAAEHLARSLASFPVVGKPEAKRVTEELFAKAAAQVGTLKVKVSPSRARVKIGERGYGEEDYRDQVFVEAGDVTVSAGDLAGYAPESKKVHVEKGKTAEVEFALKLVADSPSATATVSAAPSVVPSGTAGAGASVPVLVTGGAVALAGIAAGIGLLVASGDKRSEADKLREGLVAAGGTAACSAKPAPVDCKAADDAYKQRDLLGNLGGSLLLGGGLVGVTTAVYWIVARVKSKPVPVQTGIVATPNGGAITISGSF